MLPDGAAVDVERAVSATEQGEMALASDDASAALGSARAALAILGGEFMSGDELPWVEERRRELAEFRLRALELEVAAGIASRPCELSAAERAARTLVASAPFRESGHRLLMEVLAARGDAAEALRAYDALRVLLREELGTAPGPAVQEVHARLLAGELGPAPAQAAPAEPTPPGEERKLLSVLCAELEPPGDPADPEELRAALGDVEQRMRAAVERLGGSVQDVAPLQALFGAAATHEDDAERGSGLRWRPASRATSAAPQWRAARRSWRVPIGRPPARSSCGPGRCSHRRRLAVWSWGRRPRAPPNEGSSSRRMRT